MRDCMYRLLPGQLEVGRTPLGSVTGRVRPGWYHAAVPRCRPVRPWSILLAALVFAPVHSASAQVPTPEQHFGFRMGADGRLATADQIEKYFEAVAAKSDRVRIVDVGQTTEG